MKKHLMLRKSKALACAVLGSLALIGYAAPVLAAEQDGVQSFTLDTVVVTASRIPQSIYEAKADISVVNREQIEKMHMGTVEEVLRTVPGVQFLNYGSNGANANLSSVRINGSKDIVVLVDGVRVSDFQGSGSSGYMYASILNNMDNIERIEVLRGASGAIYGSGAKGGVINIITRKIQNTKTTVDISKGSFSKEAYRFNTQGQRAKLGYNLYYNKSLIGDTKDGNGNLWPGRTNTKNKGIKFTYDFNDDHKLTFSYDKLSSDYHGQDWIYDNKFQGDYSSNSLTLKYDAKISAMWSNALTYRRNDVVTNYGQVYDNGAAADYSTGSDFSYDFVSDQVNFVTERNTLIFGFDYSKGVDNIPTKVGQGADGWPIFAQREMSNWSYYIQDDWQLLPRVTLSGGLRYDKPDGDAYAHDMDTNTAKSYKLSYDITDKDTLYAGRSDYFILPSMDQLYNSKWGNAKLKPAEGRTTSIGYNKKFDDDNLLTVNWYKTESDTIIGYDDGGQYQNYTDAVTRGWNAQLVTKLDENWSANIGWAHMFHHAKGDNYEMGYYPKDMATFGIHYSKDKLGAGLEGYYFMRRLNPDYSEMQGWPADNYAVMNLSVNYSPTKNITFYTKVDNLLDKLYAEHTNVIHQGGEPGSWYAMPGRSFVLGMQLLF